MKVNGELLTAEDREKMKTHSCKNWNLHEMSLYVEKGYDAIEDDAETAKMLKNALKM